MRGGGEVGEARLMVIGGAPRCGKSHLVNMFLREHPGWDTVRLDFFRDMVGASFGRRYLTDEEVLSWRDPKAAVSYYLQRDAEAAELAAPYIAKLLKHGHDVICEGLFPPGYSHGFFAADDAGRSLELCLARNSRDVDAELAVLGSVNADDDDPRGSWTSRLSGPDLATFAEVEMEYGRRLERQCEHAHGVMFVDMAAGDYGRGSLDLMQRISAFAGGAR